MVNFAEQLRRCSYTAVMLVAAAPLYADPVTLTSGLVRTNIRIVGGGAVFEVAGADFFWSSAGDFHSPLALCAPCPDGTTSTLGGTMSLSNRGGSLVWNGVTYNDASFYGRGTFTTDEVVMSGSGPFSLATPFRFEGLFDMYLQGAPYIPAFSMSLIGSGTALAQFFQYPDLPGWIMPEGEGLTYTFEAQQQSPVPEPTSLVLIGTGLAGLVVRRWRSRAER
jgi:hypothetical protein